MQQQQQQQQQQQSQHLQIWQKNKIVWKKVRRGD